MANGLRMFQLSLRANQTKLSSAKANAIADISTQSEYRLIPYRPDGAGTTMGRWLIAYDYLIGILGRDCSVLDVPRLAFH